MDEVNLNRIGQRYLALAESKFGHREQTTFHGFKFWNNNVSQLMGDRSSGFTIYISAAVQNDDLGCHFQCAHEAFHMLSPTTYDSVSVFEEGAATLFQFEIFKTPAFKGFYELYMNHLINNSPRYYFATQKVLSVLGDYANIIQQIRATFPHKIFSDLLSSDLISIPEIPSTLSSILATKFNTLA